MTNKFFIKLIIFITCVCFLSSTAFGQADSPLDRVKGMLQAVMAIQGDPGLQGSGFRNKRRMDIRRVIGANFNTPHMAREALGSQWEKLSKPDQEEFTRIFEDLFQDSYSRLVLDFLGQENIDYGQPESNGTRAEISTTILRPNEEIPVSYSLMTVNRQWLVYDVKIDGISIVDKYRRSFARVMAKESYQALLAKMRLQQQAVHRD